MKILRQKAFLCKILMSAIVTFAALLIWDQAKLIYQDWPPKAYFSKDKLKLEVGPKDIEVQIKQNGKTLQLRNSISLKPAPFQIWIKGNIEAAEAASFIGVSSESKVLSVLRNKIPLLIFSDTAATPLNKNVNLILDDEDMLLLSSIESGSIFSSSEEENRRSKIQDSYFKKFVGAKYFSIFGNNYFSSCSDFQDHRKTSCVFDVYTINGLRMGRVRNFFLVIFLQTSFDNLLVAKNYFRTVYQVLEINIES